MSGFVVIRREALEHFLIGDERHFRPWCWLISTACWKPARFNIKGKTIQLQRGQLCASIRQMADAWGWSKSAVERFLIRLETETMIEREAGHGRCIISIRNYDKYQDIPNRQRDSSGTATGTTAGQQRDTKEPVNQNIPLPNGNGADDFWKFAVSYLGESKRSLIGRWCRDFGGQPPVARAITDAQFAHAVEPVAYIEKALRLQRADAEEVPIV